MKKLKLLLLFIIVAVLSFSAVACAELDEALEIADEIYDAVEESETIIGGADEATSIVITEEPEAEATEEPTAEETAEASAEAKPFDIADVPEFDGENAYTAINNNVPYFTEDEITTESFEEYSELDSLGRCGMCIASVGTDIMPTEERGSISSVKPTGWQTVKYDCVDGKYLYNRCHLIGYQLTGENANKQNLITGTRYLNIDGMLIFENMVADYVKETENHVMYRVTPIFEGDNLVASGVLMEAYSVEDEGDGICFCVYSYNVQPGVVIDYATGESELAE